MLKRFALATALLTFGLALSFDDAHPQPSPTQPSPIKRTILQRTDVPRTNLELIVATVEIPAGFKAGRHTNPGVSIAQVIDGDFWIQVEGQPERVLHPGDSSITPDHAIHNEGAMDKPVKLSAAYVLEKGQPFASPVR
jgi:quercetin dioxygenase-like cupin family protein